MDRSGYGEDLLTVLKGVLRRDQGAALLRRFHHQHSAGEAGDDTVAPWEMELAGRRTGWKLTDQATSLGQPPGQLSMLRWIGDVQPVAQHRDRVATHIECGAVRDAVDAAGQPADDHIAGTNQPHDEGDRGVTRVSGMTARADHRDPGTMDQLRPTQQEEHRRRLLQLAQRRRIVRVRELDPARRRHGRLLAPF